MERMADGVAMFSPQKYLPPPFFLEGVSLPIFRPFCNVKVDFPLP